MDTARRSSSISTTAGLKFPEPRKQVVLGACTYIRLYHGDNQHFLVNSFATCRRLLDYIKSIIGIQRDELLDLMDHEGKLKELNTHSDEYASQYLPARHTYYALKIETDSATGEKRYTPNFDLEHVDQKLNTIFTHSLNALNKASGKGKRVINVPRQTPAAQSPATAVHAKPKRTLHRR